MNKRLVISLLFLMGVFAVFGQLNCPIYNLRKIKVVEQKNVNIANTQGSKVRTQGVVTYILPDSTGFYMQSLQGDNKVETSDAIFVNSVITVPQIALHNLIALDAFIVENTGRFELQSISNVEVLKTNQQVAAQAVTFPEDFDNSSQYDGMQLTFNQKLYLNGIDKLDSYEEFTLSSTRRFTPTEKVIPGSQDFRDYLTRNEDDQIYLKVDPSDYPAEDGLQRLGRYVENITAVYSDNYGGVLTPVGSIEFQGNPRPTVFEKEEHCNLRLCCFNVEIYITQQFDRYGPKNSSEAERHGKRVAKALLALDADIFGLVEIQNGQSALKDIVGRLNAATQAGRYAYVNDGSNTSGTYIKVGYVYRTDKVKPKYKIMHNDEYPGPRNRRKAQAFTLLSNNESFVYLVNHYKAKVGRASGDDADQQDGQGGYNYTRTKQAESTLSFASRMKVFYGDDDVLIMGDLNAHSMEDPVRTLTAGEYTNLVTQYDPKAYTYVHQGQVGVLDHAIANASMAKQIKKVEVIHLNADEPKSLSYEYTSNYMDMYRSSDHDPVVVSVRLGQPTDTQIVEMEPKIERFQDDKDALVVYDVDHAQLVVVGVDGRMCAKVAVNGAMQRVDLNRFNLAKGVYVAYLVDKQGWQKEPLKFIY